MKLRYRVAGIVICVAVLVAVQVWRRRADKNGPMRPAYSGDSTGLKATVIVPTLDTPMPPGKNVIWCSSFQIAWNRLKDDVVKAPVQVKGAEDVAKRLNDAPQSEKDLTPESYYAAAGYINQGIADQIRSAMAQKFPNAPPPRFGVENAPGLNPIVAYAYLAASVKFTKPYNDSERDLHFRDSAGTVTPVASFGFAPWERNYDELARQMAVLWYGQRDQPWEEECAVDLCKDSQPNQLVLALVAPKTTLAQTYKHVRENVDAAAAGDRDRANTTCVLVPKTAWKVIHHLKELEGPDKVLGNPGFKEYFISLAQQDIDFKLDQSGAALVSEAKTEVVAAAAPRLLPFDRPFLIFMRKRGATEPFFVMWVDNAELLTKR